MTYTLPFLHRYRFIIAILLTAFVSTSMIAFKMASSAPAQAATETNSQVSAYVVPVIDDTSHVKSSSENGSINTLLDAGKITADGKLTFERPAVRTTPAPKKEEPVAKKTEDPKSDTTANANAAAAPVAPPAAANTSTNTQVQSEDAAPAQSITPAPAPANNSAPASPVASAPMAGTSPAAAQAFARSYLTSKGMGDSEFQCLVTLWNHESGWNFQATNSSSGAYGIPQSLPGSKMASAGADWQTNPQTQIIWGVGYITGRYGTPCGAVAIWNTRGWY